jgi:hypothetical protein
MGRDHPAEHTHVAARISIVSTGIVAKLFVLIFLSPPQPWKFPYSI